MRSDTVDIEGYLVTETEDAYCMRVDDDTFKEEAKRYWIPKSQSEITLTSTDPAKLVIFTISEWLATEKGLV